MTVFFYDTAFHFGTLRSFRSLLTHFSQFVYSFFCVCRAWLLLVNFAFFELFHLLFQHIVLSFKLLAIAEEKNTYAHCTLQTKKKSIELFVIVWKLLFVFLVVVAVVVVRK